MEGMDSFRCCCCFLRNWMIRFVPFGGVLLLFGIRSLFTGSQTERRRKVVITRRQFEAIFQFLARDLIGSPRSNIKQTICHFSRGLIGGLTPVEGNRRLMRQSQFSDIP